ncbi:alpha/beta-hydrolase [Annulohypoxylon maeteangense]|uniref:alpha/beta-hydrolase n=1 Tax=Annulohypoxylon maeteangense TaxID=1927788 RepID=UPI0020081D28|nr:alpha/beta-hydrolase [Annulohypoxylon maeteangense]KAI0883655.1 alpha/beta-hydrolase [Annulohypoxylon maeteangense]
MSSDSVIQPYRIAVPDAAIARLRKKLELATFPQETSFSNDWGYGAPLDDIKRLAGVWRETYDWKRAEADLNEKLPQFITRIGVEGHEDDLKVHFVHKKSEKSGAIPLLFCHGWPGSFIEVSKILPLLTASDRDDEPTFHVVAPSLPNFGFSQGTSRPGFGIPQQAEVCHKLMLQLGYTKYVTQGGDWGFMISRALGKQYPAHVIGSHLNLILTRPPSLLSSPLLCLQYALGWFSAHEKIGFQRTKQFRVDGDGYSRIQGTKPHTLGISLADSPIGLLAWIYEKLWGWTDAYGWTDEEVLTWISVYAFSEAGADASVRLYYEVTHKSKSMDSLLEWNGKVPLGLSYFPKDVIVLPSSWGKTLGPVVHEKRHQTGGHFAAFEKPEDLVDDIKTFAKTGGLGAKLTL